MLPNSQNPARHPLSLPVIPLRPGSWPSSTPAHGRRWKAIAALAACAWACSAQARPQACVDGNPHQARSVCLKEQRAARAEAGRHGLTTPSLEKARANALARCSAFSASDDRDSCEARILSPTDERGDPLDGGLLRESRQTEAQTTSTPD